MSKDPRLFKLGKRAKRTDPRTFKLARYLRRDELPPPPRVIDWSQAGDQKYPMFQNDNYGCCVAVTAAHMVELWTANAREEQTLTDADVLKAYADVGGFVPGDPSTDKGMIMLDFLKYLRKTGIGGHKIMAFAEVNPRDPWEMQMALWLFGGLAVGLALPFSAQIQLEDKEPWTATPLDGGLWGGHAVALVAGGPDTRTCITWAALQLIEHGFFKLYCDEAYAVLSEDWITKAGLSPSGFDLAALKRDLAAL